MREELTTNFENMKAEGQRFLFCADEVPLINNNIVGSRLHPNACDISYNVLALTNDDTTCGY